MNKEEQIKNAVCELSDCLEKYYTYAYNNRRSFATKVTNLVELEKIKSRVMEELSNLLTESQGESVGDFKNWLITNVFTSPEHTEDCLICREGRKHTDKVWDKYVENYLKEKHE